MECVPSALNSFSTSVTLYQSIPLNALFASMFLLFVQEQIFKSVEVLEMIQTH